MADDWTTDLVISGDGMPPYAMRGLSQTLDKLPGVVRRTINGQLKDLSREAFRKYRSTITNTDQQAPALDRLWPGMQVTVDCAKELSYKTAGGAASRTVVPGSTRVEGDFTFYRPRLVMRVISCPQSVEEWAASEQWTIELEEI